MNDRKPRVKGYRVRQTNGARVGHLYVANFGRAFASMTQYAKCAHMFGPEPTQRKLAKRMANKHAMRRGYHRDFTRQRGLDINTPIVSVVSVVRRKTVGFRVDLKGGGTLRVQMREFGCADRRGAVAFIRACRARASDETFILVRVTRKVGKR